MLWFVEASLHAARRCLARPSGRSPDCPRTQRGSSTPTRADARSPCTTGRCFVNHVEYRGSHRSQTPRGESVLGCTAATAGQRHDAIATIVDPGAPRIRPRTAPTGATDDLGFRCRRMSGSGATLPTLPGRSGQADLPRRADDLRAPAQASHLQPPARSGAVGLEHRVFAWTRWTRAACLASMDTPWWLARTSADIHRRRVSDSEVDRQPRQPSTPRMNRGRAR